jgi:hypothetical protein
MMKDYGLSDTGEMKVEHLLTLSLASSIEKPFLKALLAITESGRDAAKALKIVGYGVAGYLFLLGISKVIDASGKLIAAKGKKGRLSG